MFVRLSAGQAYGAPPDQAGPYRLARPAAASAARWEEEEEEEEDSQMTDTLGRDRYRPPDAFGKDRHSRPSEADDTSPTEDRYFGGYADARKPQHREIELPVYRDQREVEVPVPADIEQSRWDHFEQEPPPPSPPPHAREHMLGNAPARQPPPPPGLQPHAQAPVLKHKIPEPQQPQTVVTEVSDERSGDLCFAWLSTSLLPFGVFRLGALRHEC